jgi:hypothetical protein
VDADLVEAAAALRWARPDLTAELADHVLEEASATGRQDRWLAAAGWAVHARSATGDGRETACRVLAGLTRWGSDALTGAAAHRLRIELAMVAAGAGEVEFARRLLAGVAADDSDPELTADLLCAHARCAVEDAPDEVAAVLDSADAAWNRVGGAAAHLGGASVTLVRAVVERRAGRSAAAVDHAAEGLARLERARAGSGTPSGHLAAALAAEWISALLDAGRITEARDGCGALLPRLSEQVRPTRQLALLRLTVTRVLAAQDTRADTAQLLAQAAEDAAGSDVPDLEAVCRTALGALHEQAERLDVALEELQLAVGAERRDRSRSRRFLAALAELPVEAEQPKRRRERAGAAAATRADETISTDATTVLPAITRGDRKLKANRADGPDHGKPRPERLPDEPSPVAEAESAAAEERRAAWDAVPWSGGAGESPIGDLLIRSLRAGSAEPSENGSAHRNGKSVGASVPRSDEPDASSGWVPALDADRPGEEQPRARRGGRSAQTGRRRSHRARDEQDDATSAPLGGSETAGPNDAPGVQERPTRSRRRSRPDDDRAGDRADAADERPARGRHGRPGDVDDAGSDEGGRVGGKRSGSGARRRAEEPAIVAPWTPLSDEPGPDEPGPEPVVAAAPAGASDDSDGWLQAALAELDRALSGIGVGGPPRLETAPADAPPVDAPRVETPRSDTPPSDGGDGCAVVVDIARDGRRFAGPRASAVVRSVADLLADRLPEGARSRFGDSDALVVTRAGWSRADATDWMHRTLPGLLDGFVAAEELPGAQLRVAVHDLDGPVGAQILQPLTPAGRERDSAAEQRRGDPAGDPWDDLTTSMSEARGQQYRAAAQAGRQERGPRGAQAQDAAPGVEPATAGESPRWPFSGAAETPGRHGADRAGSAGPARADTGAPGRRRRADDQDQASGEQVPPKAAEARGGSRRGGGERPSSTGPAGNGSHGNGSAGNGSRANGSIGNGSTGNGSTGNGVANGAGAGANGAGRRAKREADSAPSAAEHGDEQVTTSERGKAERTESTEGLGIADLLAGALAAYRGI